MITTGGEQTRRHQLQQENNGCGEHQRQKEEENGHGDINAPRPPLILEGELGDTRLPRLDKRGLGGVECYRRRTDAGTSITTGKQRMWGTSTLGRGRERARGDINAPRPPLILEGELGNTRLPRLDKRGLGGVECNRTTGGAGGFNNTDGSRNSTLGREQTRGDINAPRPPLILEGELGGTNASLTATYARSLMPHS